MAYVTADYYATVYGGDPVEPVTDFGRYESRAADLVDVVTRFAIPQAGGLCALPAFQRTLVKKAVCAQVNYYVTEGGLDISIDGSSSGAGFTVGKVSVNGGTASTAIGSKANGAGMLCPAAYNCLEAAGLLNRCVETADWRWR